MQTNRIKITVSAVILIVGLVATVLALPGASDDTANSGILVDFGDYTAYYTGVDSGAYGDPVSALRFACEANDFSLEMDGNSVVSIAGTASDGTSSWGLYVVEGGDNEWTAIDSDPTSLSITDYSVVCWGYCDSESVPSPAVDMTGVPFHGYGESDRIVTLSPSCTEYVCSLGAIDSLVATDYYSNYPVDVVDRQNAGMITFIGGFTNPSYETILKQDPDIVICEDSVSAHLSIAEKLRKAGINVLVTSGGESIDAVLDNMHMVGVVLEESSEARDLIERTSLQMDTMGFILDSNASVWDKRTMVALSAVKAPFVAGSGTYISDILSVVHGDNIYQEEYGWPQINVESVVKLDPEVIIIVTTGYKATEEGYNIMLDSLSNEWKSTTAYENGEIYMLTDAANDLVSRPGPRVAQVAELTARILHPVAFHDGVDVPKYIGSEYADYLSITTAEDVPVVDESSIIIDFGDYDVTFTEVDATTYGDPLSALQYACDRNGILLELDGDRILSIDGIYTHGDDSWGLYVVEEGDTEWTRMTSGYESLYIGDYTAVCWGYCASDAVPAPAVDKSGVTIYGYGEIERIVTLSPSCTEYVYAMGALDLIVGTDDYSNYPSVIVDRREAGIVASIGGYTNPSYEAIISLNPDLVVCQESPGSHRTMAERLREAGMDVLMMSAGETPEAVPENMFLLGTVLGDAESTAELVMNLEGDIETIGGILDSDVSISDKRTMVAVSVPPVAYVVGSDTFLNDIMSMVRADNVFSDEPGWLQATGDMVEAYDPEVIVFALDSSAGMSATEVDYLNLMDSLPSEWKSTTAYQNGEVYILVDGANDLASRVGPRLAQATELFARIIHPDSFDDGVKVPKYIGDDYVDYLSITIEGVI